jgi:transposase
MMKQRKGKRKVAAGELKVIRPDVAGVDLGSREHYVCAPSVEGAGRDVEGFGSTTAELYRLADWLVARGVRSVAMESTGVYWISVYEVLESRGLEVVLVNARVLLSVPGRKTDVLDCQWIQLLHSCGLLRGSFRPADAICGVRALIRERSVLVRESGDWIRRMQKSLDQMNVRVHHAVADISGITGMAIIRRIVAGERDPQVLAELRDPRCQKTQAEIAEHLRGNWRAEHLFTLGQGLKMYDFTQRCMEEYDAQIMQRLAELEKPNLMPSAPADLPRKDKMKSLNRREQQPLRHALYRMSGVDLTTIDAIGVETAELVLSELGTDYSVFPTEGHFVSYLKLSPKLAISGGKPIRSKKPMSTSTRVGAALRMAATTLRHSKTALGGEFRRLARLKGVGIAVFAMARKLAILIYRLIRFGQAYVDQGLEAYEQRFRQQRLHACQNMANSLGFKLVATETPHA